MREELPAWIAAPVAVLLIGALVWAHRRELAEWLGFGGRRDS